MYMMFSNISSKSHILEIYNLTKVELISCPLSQCICRKREEGDEKKFLLRKKEIEKEGMSECES